MMIHLNEYIAVTFSTDVCLWTTNPSKNSPLQLYQPSVSGTGFIRQAKEERISNRRKKHSNLTLSSQQLKRDIILILLDEGKTVRDSHVIYWSYRKRHPEEELVDVLPANKAKELILSQIPFLGLHKSKVWNKHMIPFCLLWEARDPERRNRGKSDADKAGGIRRLFVFGKDEKEYIAYVFVLCVVWFFCSTASVYLAAGSADQEESEAEHEHKGWRCRKKGV